MLPWHIHQWQLLWKATQNNRLPHALLLTGACDLEIKHFVEGIAATLLCKKPLAQGNPCETCHACHLVKAKSHPDLLWVLPLEAGQIIKVDQIREVVLKVNETSMQGGLRIVIVNPAHAMNMAAANALLKTLEEPSANTLLILISDQRLRLPTTIASRCQKIIFPKPSNEMASKWLQSKHLQETELLLGLANGFPLTALAFHTDEVLLLRQSLYQGLYAMKRGQLDPLSFASQCQAFDATVLLMLLQVWICDLLRFRLTQGRASLINTDYYAIFAEISSAISLDNSVIYADLVKSTYIKILNRINLNKQLLFEELWITWTRYVSC